MRFCKECFNDPEIRADIEGLSLKGTCPICKKKDVSLFDFDQHHEISNTAEYLDSILKLYKPVSSFSIIEKNYIFQSIEDALLNDWDIFSGTKKQVRKLIEEYVKKTIVLQDKILTEKVCIPQLYDEAYLNNSCFMGIYSWSDFKKYLRNVNRFHTKYIKLDLLENILRQTETKISKGTLFYRARISNKEGEKGFTRKEMWAPPDDVATPGRVNSKGQSCLYLSSKKNTTVKEIRAHAFDYVTIATFRLQKEIKILDLTSITHNSPFYSEVNKIDYLINEKILKEIESDLAKPMSRWDSELDYLPTQYISDFAKFLEYDGVKYNSTFDPKSYNVALFDASKETCECTYHANFRIDALDYKLNKVKKKK